MIYETVPIEKNIGRAKITNEELIFVIAEVKIAANTRPLYYVSSSIVDEPLTPLTA